MLKFVIATILLVLVSCSGHTIAGTWNGTVDINDSDIPVVIYIKDLGDGKFSATFDNPSMNVKGKKIDAVSYKGGTISLSSIEFDFIYSGTLSEDKKRFEGELDFRGELYTLTLLLKQKK